MYIYFLTKVFAFQNPQSLAWSWDKDIEYWFWTASGKYLSQSSGITGSTKSRRSTIWWSAKYCEHIQKKSVSVEFPENMTTAFSFLHGFNEVSNGLKKNCKSINGTIIYNFFSLWTGCGKNWFQSVWWPWLCHEKYIYRISLILPHWPKPHWIPLATDSSAACFCVNLWEFFIVSLFSRVKDVFTQRVLSHLTKHKKAQFMFSDVVTQEEGCNYLCFKTSPCAKRFLWKWVWLRWKWSYRWNTLIFITMVRHE